MIKLDTDKYWKEVHKNTDSDLSAVCYPNLPLFFNIFVDGIFNKVLMKAVSELHPSSAIEIGCGRGRWLDRLRKRKWNIFGIDIAADSRADVIASCDTLPIRKNSLDAVLAITVLQHISDERKLETIRNVNKVLRNGGTFLLIELLYRKGVVWQKHMFPKEADWWRKTLIDNGFKIEREIPVEHLPILKLIESIKKSGKEETAIAAEIKPSYLKKFFWFAVTILSILLEPCARNFFPESASHRMFIVKKV